MGVENVKPVEMNSDKIKEENDQAITAMAITMAFIYLAWLIV
jgi:hypothetical protein